MRTILALCLLVLASSVAAQDGHRHPQSDLEAHKSFYWYLTRPDIPAAPRGSCCSDGDCYATPARIQDGRWWALRREDRQWIEIPEYRVVTRPDELARRPDHQATLCAVPTFIYCFVPPEGGV